MARTDAASVALVIEVDSSIDLTVFIDTANEMVTELCTGTTNGPTPAYSSTRLELIERWLAAHFYAVRDNRRTQEQAGPVMESFQFKLGLGLDVTMYGQQVKILDTNGSLAKYDEQSKGNSSTASMSWLGKVRT
jgi:hypothetical protein